MRELVQLWRANASNLKHGTMIMRELIPDDTLRVAFTSADGGDVLASALKSAVAAKDVGFIAKGCELISVLCLSNEDIRKQLGALGSCFRRR